MLNSSRTSAALILGITALVSLPASPASAQTTLPGASLWSVSEAGGQLFWTGSTDGARVNLYTRPTAGGETRQLGTAPGPGSGAFPTVAFDGTNYAVVLYRQEEVDSSGGDCGVCEPDEFEDSQIIVGRIDGAPKAVLKCSTAGDGTPPVATLAAGRTFLAGLRCGAPAGIVTVDGAGALATFDLAGSLPLAGAGNWLTYATKDATKVSDLAGGGTYTVPIATNPNAPEFLGRALLLQSDGSIVVSGAFFRAGGTTPRVPVRTKWYYPREPLFAGDRLFYDGLTQLSLTTAQGPRTIVAGGLEAKRALALTGSMLDVAGYSCTGAVTVRTLDLGAATPAGAVDGCPLEVTTRALRLTSKRTIAVTVRCVNGCAGTLTLKSGSLELRAKVRSGVSTVRYRLTSKQAKAAGRRATFVSSSPWLTVNDRSHRLNRPRR